MRGKVQPEPKVKTLERITPAYAGKSAGVRCSDADRQDHPRLCGEKKHYILPFSVAIGSPPPMRGKVVRHTHTQDRFRITPAYAGKRNRLEFQPSSI